MGSSAETMFKIDFRWIVSTLNTLLGSRTRDTLFGSSARDTLFGSSARDTLFGSRTRDTLFGSRTIGDDSVMMQALANGSPPASRLSHSSLWPNELQKQCENNNDDLDIE